MKAVPLQYAKKKCDIFKLDKRSGSKFVSLNLLQPKMKEKLGQGENETLILLHH